MPEPPAPAAAPVASALGPLHRGDRGPLVTADGQPIAALHVGLGWTAAQAGRAIDLDASAITFDAQGTKDEIIWRRNRSEYQGAVQHLGDHRTGAGPGVDAEAIIVELARVPATVESLAFTINSITGDRFTDLAAAHLRLVDRVTGYEVARFDLTDTQPSTAVIMAIVKRNPAVAGGWEMQAIGEFHDTRFVKRLVDAAQRHAAMP